MSATRSNVDSGTRRVAGRCNLALAVLLGALVLGTAAQAQIISTVAGNGIQGFSGDGGPATAANLNFPVGVAVDAGGNLFIADDQNHRMRKVTPGGVISTVAGNGIAGFGGDGGPATAASLSFPFGVAVDAGGNLFIGDLGNQRIRKVTPGGVISTVAGNGTFGFSGDGGPATAASLATPSGVAVDAGGNLFIAEQGNHRIRKVTPGGVISTVAGNGIAGFGGDGGPATAANLNFPAGVAVDAGGNLIIADDGNHRIRKVTPGGVISTVAGNGIAGFGGDGGPATAANLNFPAGVALDAGGNLFIADNVNLRVRKVTVGGVISTVAGNGIAGFSGDGGLATAASLTSPAGVAVDAGGNLFIGDYYSERIRKVASSAAPPPQLLQLRVVALNNAVTATVSDARPANSGPLTVETEVRQGTLVQVLRAILGPSSDTQQVFRNLQNGTSASVATYTIDAIGNRTPAGSSVTATPTAPPNAAVALGTSKPPVLLANGFASGASTWDVTRAALGDAFRVSAVTLQSPVFDSPCREALQLRDAIGALKRLQASKRVIVVGHSQGGLVARLYLQAGKDPGGFGEYMRSRDNFLFAMGGDCAEALSAIAPFFELNDVAALITYGTPHGGADSTVFNSGRSHPMLRAGSGFLAGLNNFAANAPFPFPKDTVVTSLIGRTSPTIFGDDDCVVSAASQNMKTVGYSSPTHRKVDVIWRKHASIGCVVSDVFRTTETDDHTAILAALGASVLRINVLSPVDIVVTSPSGRVIEKASTAIWGATYEEFTDATGDRKKVVTVPFPELGSYQIRVVPDAAAAPTATFSIETELDGTKTTPVNHASIADAISSPFVVLQRVDNRLPIVNAGPDQVVECTSPSGANVLLNGSASSDPDGDPLTYVWSGPFGTATGSTPTVAMPLGQQTIDLTLSDGKGGTAFANMRAVVQDTTPPAATVTLTPGVLWPPNHKLVPIEAMVQVRDACDSRPQVSLISITSNQPDSGLDESDVPGDILGATFGSDDRNFLVRAERAGEATLGLTTAAIKLGRTYTAKYRVTDKSGNAVVVSGKVTIPHSQGK